MVHFLSLLKNIDMHIVNKGKLILLQEFETVINQNNLSEQIEFILISFVQSNKWGGL